MNGPIAAQGRDGEVVGQYACTDDDGHAVPELRRRRDRGGATDPHRPPLLYADNFLVIVSVDRVTPNRRVRRSKHRKITYKELQCRFCGEDWFPPTVSTTSSTRPDADHPIPLPGNEDANTVDRHPLRDTSRPTGLAESPVLSNGHVGFDGRPGETDQPRDRHRASADQTAVRARRTRRQYSLWHADVRVSCGSSSATTAPSMPPGPNPQPQRSEELTARHLRRLTTSLGIPSSDPQLWTRRAWRRQCSLTTPGECVPVSATWRRHGAPGAGRPRETLDLPQTSAFT